MPKIIDKEEKASAISDAAMKVFRDKGFSKTRMIDIAEASGVGKGTLYEYFKDKVDILRYAFDQYFNSFSEGLGNAMVSETNPLKKLLTFIDFALIHVAEWEDHCAAYIEYFSTTRPDEDRFSLSCQYGQMKGIIIHLVRECQSSGEIDRAFDPEVVSELLVSIYDGLIVHRLLEGKKIEMGLLREALGMLIRGGLFNPDIE